MSESEFESLPPALFDRIDGSPDSRFYVMPRFVAHIDPATIMALTDYYRDILGDGDDVLDLMSSWISHLPDDIGLERVAGLGMNEAELAANPRLTDFAVHDLNENPGLPYADGTFDAVLIAVSIQYLTTPIAVFREIARVLRPGGRAVVATSHRCFPTKAIRAFREAQPSERITLISAYYAGASEFGPAEFIDRSPAGSDPLWLITANRRIR